MNIEQDNTVTTTVDDYHSAIGKAIHLIRTGRRVPYDLAVELMQEGFDVQALEARYSR